MAWRTRGSLNGAFSTFMPSQTYAMLGWSLTVSPATERSGSAAAGASTAKSSSPERSARSVVRASEMKRMAISSKWGLRPAYAGLRRSVAPFWRSNDVSW